MSQHCFIGTAGWSIPGVLADRFENSGTHLERYASRFNAVEINSSFYRAHRKSTYERWAASVPDNFRFAVKLPKTISHERRLTNCGDLLKRFSDDIAGLGAKRGAVLVQLPPSLAFDYDLARRFFNYVRDILDGPIVCEPRHASWFNLEADALLTKHRIARVAADPSITSEGAEPGGWLGLYYFRLHGAPRTYWSDYPSEAIERHAECARRLLAADRDVWTIFDNTAAGHAAQNALSLTAVLNGNPL